MKLKVGLIGYGLMGKRYFNHLIKDKSFTVVKILKKKVNNKNLIFTKNKIEFFKHKYDLIIISSPVKTHALFISLSLKKNSHIIVEKPLVYKKKELNLFNKKIIKKFNKKFIVHHSELNNPEYIKFKNKIIRTQSINMINLNFIKKSEYIGKNNYPFFDWFPHPISLMIDLLGMPNDVIIKKKNFQFKNKKIIQNIHIIFYYKTTTVNLFFNNIKKTNKKNIVVISKKKIFKFSRNSKSSSINYMLNVIKNKKIYKNDIKLSVDTMSLIFKIKKLIKL
jgi:predicted dehydrogenase